MSDTITTEQLDALAALYEAERLTAPAHLEAVMFNAFPALLALARSALAMQDRLDAQIPIVSYGTQAVLWYIRDGNDDDAIVDSDGDGV